MAITEENFEDAVEVARIAIVKKLQGEGKKRTSMEVSFLLAKVEAYLFDGLTAAGISTNFSLTHNSKEEKETSSEDRSTEDDDRSVTNEVEKKTTAPSICKTISALEGQKKKLPPGDKRDDIALQRAGIYAALDSLSLTHLLQPQKAEEKKVDKTPKGTTAGHSDKKPTTTIKKGKSERPLAVSQTDRHLIITQAHEMTKTRFHSLDPEHLASLAKMVSTVEKLQVTNSLLTSLQRAKEASQFATARPHVADYFFNTATDLFLQAQQRPQQAGATR